MTSEGHGDPGTAAGAQGQASPGSTYAEFRLRIERGARKRQYRIIASGPGGEVEGPFRMPFSDLELENFVLKVGGTRQGVRGLDSPEMDLAKRFGTKLFDALFETDVRGLYRASRVEAANAGQGLRITLALSSVPELLRVPWEYLYDKPLFPSTDTRTPIVRYLDLPKPIRPLHVKLPLRILAIVSAPTDAQPIDGAQERAKLEEALGPLLTSGSVEIEWLEDANLAALHKLITRKDRSEFHILHFIGHGGYVSEAKQGVLLFEGKDGKRQNETGDKLGTILHGEESLRLAVLNSCEGARASINDPFSSVATSLIEHEIPAVIGMQFEITDRAAILFSGEFYAALADGRAVDEALSQARMAIFADNNDIEWGTPVLFMRVNDGRLFDVAIADDPARAAEAERRRLELEAAAEAERERLAQIAAAAEEQKRLDDAAARALAEAAAAGAGAAAAGAAPGAAPPAAEDEADEGAAADAAAAAEAERKRVEAQELAAEEERQRAAVAAAVAKERKRIEDEEAAARERERLELEAAVEAASKRREAEAAAEARRLEEARRRRRRRNALILGGLVGIPVIAFLAVLLPNLGTSISVIGGPGGDPAVVRVTGRGYQAHETVRFDIDGVVVGTAPADGDGTFDTSIPIPDSAPPTILVGALGETSGRVALSTFTRAIGPTMSTGPSEAVPTASGDVPPPSDGSLVPPPPSEALIVFYSNVQPGSGDIGDSEIYVIDPVTRELTALTNNDVDDSFPTWSPDRTQIAFNVGRAGDRDIYVMDAAGGSVRPLVTGPTDDWFPAWSVGGNIAFVRGANDSQIWVVREEGGEPQPWSVPPPGTRLRSPAWAPDGSILAVWGDPAEPGNDDLYLLHFDGTLQRVTVEPFVDRNPTWSPDGTTLAFVRDTDGSRRTNEDNEIYLLDIASGGLKQLTVNDVQDGNPVWSPDGQQIAFYRAEGSGFHLRVIGTTDLESEDLMPGRPGRNLDPNWR